MYSGPRAFCILMALAAAGSEVVSAASGQVAIAAPTIVSDQCCIESISEAKVAPVEKNGPVGSKSSAVAVGLVPMDAQSVMVYDADGRKSASIADANERQLLFVKISRG